MSPARAGTSAVVAVVGAVGLLLVLVTWAASIGPDRVVSGGHVRAVQPDRPTSGATASGRANPLDGLPHRSTGDAPGWLGAVALALELITIGVALFLLARLLHRLREAWLARRRRQRRARAEQVDFDVLGSAGLVADALAEDAGEQRTLLSLEGEPRNAIVACWHRFEEQAGRAGMHRQPWQTTGEFVLGVLDLVGADRGAVGRLADLYREARFSDHPVTQEHRAAALAALDEIHQSLRPGRTARPPVGSDAGRP